MIRQRVRLRGIGAAGIVLRLLVSLLALAVIFYGATVVLAALKLDPHTINRISAGRTIYHELSSITGRTITGRDRIIVAAAGLLCLLTFGPLTWRALPRPYLARTDIALDDHSRPGSTDIAPRALERAAEIAARQHPQVSGAVARYGAGSVDVQVDLSDDNDLVATLRGVQRLVRDRLAEHGVPDGPVDITFAGLAT